MSDTVQQVSETTTEVGTLKIGLGQIKNPTPMWATWIFRVFFYVSNLVGIVLAMEPRVPSHTVVEILKYLAIANLAVHGLSKMIGIDTSDLESEAKSAFVTRKTAG